MKRYFSFVVPFLLWFAPAVSAQEFSELWHKLESKEKQSLILQVWLFLESVEQAEQAEEVSWWKVKLGFHYAWAADEMNCLYGGWPSRTNPGGSCKHPRRVADSGYDQGACPRGEFQCQPLLFGADHCVQVGLGLQVAAKCISEFGRRGKLVNQVVDEIDRSKRGEELSSLLQFIRGYCRPPTPQRRRGMCRGVMIHLEQLEAVINLRESRSAVETLTTLSDIKPSVVETNCLATEALTAAPLVVSSEGTSATEDVPAVTPTNQDSVSVPDVGSERPFERDTPRRSVCIGGQWLHFLHTDCLNQNVKTFAGFGFSRAPTFVGDEGSKRVENPGRIFQVRADDSSRDGSYLYLSDLESIWDSHNMKSKMYLFPRRGLPSAQEEGNLVRITLTTGEIVTVDKSTNRIVGGALQEGPFSSVYQDNGRNDNPLRGSPRRNEPNIQYNGTGMSITFYHRFVYASQLSQGGEARKVKIKQGGRTCELNRSQLSRLWDSEGHIRPNSDEAIVNEVNRLCPTRRAGETPFSL